MSKPIARESGRKDKDRKLLLLCLAGACAGFLSVLIGYWVVTSLGAGDDDSNVAPLETTDASAATVANGSVPEPERSSPAPSPPQNPTPGKTAPPTKSKPAARPKAKGNPSKKKATTKPAPVKPPPPPPVYSVAVTEYAVRIPTNARLAETKIPPPFSPGRPRDDSDERMFSDILTGFRAAEALKVPVVVVFYQYGGRSSRSSLQEWDARQHDPGDEWSRHLAALAPEYVVVILPWRKKDELAARLHRRPYASAEHDGPLFVVTRHDGRQLASSGGWKKKQALDYALAEGIVQEAKEVPRTMDQLKSVLQMVTPVGGNLKSEVERLIREAEQAQGGGS